MTRDPCQPAPGPATIRAAKEAVQHPIALPRGLVAALELAAASEIGATEVSGTLGSDATWTATASPYEVTGKVIVAQDDHVAGDRHKHQRRAKQDPGQPAPAGS